MMINTLRNDPENELIIGSFQGGYFIAKGHETYEAVKYIFGKAVNEMVTAIRMYPPLAERFIKIASRTYQDTDKSFDSQFIAQFDDDVEKVLESIVIRHADTFSWEAKKLAKEVNK